ncbi:COG3904 family protein [Shumkonia mesophila]|uniref:COG3904 family protein n=1 Tax=Shumkonia mesophila TaxID=2838854 RepID=UPI002934D5AA|nr:hypothetical protein [Shumkonia mesophila]
MGRRLSALVLAAAGLFFAIPAGAAGLEVVDRGAGRVILLAGTIQRSDVAAVTALLENPAPVREVRFDSRGGSLEAGIEIGETIRARRLATRVTAGSVCASACVYAFLGGMIRAVDGGGRIGIHMASAAFNDAYIEAVKGVLRDAASGGVDDKVRTIILLNEQFSAIAARRQARYLVQMGVSLRLLDPVFDTSHLDIHWLTPFELGDYNVVN